MPKGKGASGRLARSRERGAVYGTRRPFTAMPDAHGMDPVKVLGLARALGGPLPRTLVVACAPATVMTGDKEEVVAELSPPVAAAGAAGGERVDWGGWEHI